MLHDPPALTIRRKFPRPAAAKVARLKGCMTGHAADAMDGRGALDAAIKPCDPAHVSFVGVALTCETGPSDNLAILAALGVAEKGDVVIAAADAFRAAAVVGDNIAMMARNKGVVAIVVDGMARDLDGILAAGLPIFARGITPNSCAKMGPGRVGFPIVAGGVAVHPGDVLVGDRDGVVAVPQGELDRVLAALDEIRRLEGEVQAKIAEGLTLPDRVAALLKSDKVRWVD